MQALVAEDRESSRELIRALLEHFGYDVVEARNGVEAIERARSHVPDIMILDIQMPVRDGLSVVRELKADERFSQVPMLALTADAMPDDRERAMEAGFDAYLTKPLHIATLRQELLRFQNGPALETRGCKDPKQRGKGLIGVTSERSVLAG